MPYTTKQADVIINANARWNILCGAVSSGKTFITYDLLPIRMLTQPAGNTLLIGKTERTLKRNVLDPLRQRYGGHFISQVKGDGEVYLFGRHCYIAGANDAKSVSKIQGITLAYAYGDEVTTWDEDVFGMLKSRLRVRGALFDGTCNPDSPMHWFKQFIDDPKTRTKVWDFILDDNPYLDPEYVHDLKNEYTGMWYRRYILGEWCLAEGLIYDMYDDSLEGNLFAEPDINNIDLTKARRFTSIDYGTINPFAALDIWDDGETIWVSDEYYWDSKARHSQKTNKQYAEALADFGGGKASTHIIDPSAASMKAELRGQSIRPKDADNDVPEGIQMTASLLARRKIRIHERCINLRRELQSYAWDEKAAERGEEKPIKQNDHAADALRYFIKTMIPKWRLRR